MTAKPRSTRPLLKVFGRRLFDLRAGVSRGVIERKLQRRHVPLGGSTIAQYEAGAVWAPDPGVLLGLSQIYEQPLEDLIALLVANRCAPEAATIDELTQSRQADEKNPESEETSYRKIPYNREATPDAGSAADPVLEHAEGPASREETDPAVRAAHHLEATADALLRAVAAIEADRQDQRQQFGAVLARLESIPEDVARAVGVLAGERELRRRDRETRRRAQSKKPKTR